MKAKVPRAVPETERAVRGASRYWRVIAVAAAASSSRVGSAPDSGSAVAPRILRSSLVSKLAEVPSESSSAGSGRQSRLKPPSKVQPLLVVSAPSDALTSPESSLRRSLSTQAEMAVAAVRRIGVPSPSSRSS